MTSQNEYQENMSENYIQSSIGPGMRLQEARVKLGLSVDDIAQRLCLRVKVIESLEADHYSDFAGLVFTRGYLKAYARLVGLDANDIIDIFNNLGVEDREIAKPIWRSQHAPAQLVDYDFSKHKWLIAGASGLVVAALLWGVFHTFSSYHVTKSNTTLVSQAPIEELDSKFVKPAETKPKLAASLAPSQSKSKKIVR